MASVFENEKKSAILECSLCLFEFRKPKCLPCIHTFCLDCLQKYKDTKDSEDELSCPLCREVFTIPPQGLSGLRDNFFIASLVKTESAAELESKGKENSEVKCE